MRNLFSRLIKPRRPSIAPSVGSSASSLLTGLVSAWLEDPATSLTADSHGSNTLTNSGVTAAGGYGVFDGVSSLSLADGAAFPVTDSPFTVACQFLFDTANLHKLVNKTGWQARIKTSKNGRQAEFFAASTATLVGALLTATVYSYVGRFYESLLPGNWNTQVDILGVGNGQNTVGSSGVSGAATLYIGSDGLGSFLTGQMRRVRFWNRALTDDETLLACNPYQSFAA